MKISFRRKQEKNERRKETSHKKIELSLETKNCSQDSPFVFMSEFRVKTFEKEALSLKEELPRKVSSMI